MSDAVASMAPLHAELARSDRSTCQVCGTQIEAGTLRIGSLDAKTGTYGRWQRLACWRPSPEALEALVGAPIDVAALAEQLVRDGECALLSRTADMDEASVALLSSHLRALAAPAPPAGAQSPPPASRKRAVPTPDTAPAAKRQARPPSIEPVPDALQGLQVILTGVFPTLGGGCGLNEGKEIAAALLRDSGAAVKPGITKSMSKDRAFVLVGERPGTSKVDKARAANLKLVDLDGLRRLLNGDGLSAVDEAVITELSGGYHAA